MATIKDVAKLAGVGVGTVSRVLSGKGSVAEATVKKVHHAMESLNYRPSSVARSLSSKSQGIIGLWLPYFDSPFYNLILTSVEQELRKHNKHLVAVSGAGEVRTSDEKLSPAAGFRFLSERDCDGILVCASNLSEFELATLDDQHKNLVILNRSLSVIDDRCFSLDHVEGGRLAAQHLLTKGLTTAACLAGPYQNLVDAKERLSGFQSTYESAGYPIAGSHIIEGEYDYTSGTQGVDQLIAAGIKFDALFCANDQIAIAAISRLADHGVSVPKDVAVIGYDNSAFAAFTLPRLTSVCMPVAKLAKAATRKALHLCYGIEQPTDSPLAPSIIVRDSA